MKQVGTCQPFQQGQKKQSFSDVLLFLSIFLKLSGNIDCFMVAAMDQRSVTQRAARYPDSGGKALLTLSAAAQPDRSALRTGVGAAPDLTGSKGTTGRTKEKT
jgi:hypothetical protein